jgi:hypothetical protein
MLTAVLIGLLVGAGINAVVVPRLHRRWRRLSAHRRLGLLAPPVRHALPPARPAGFDYFDRGLPLTMHELAERIEYPERYSPSPPCDHIAAMATSGPCPVCTAPPWARDVPDPGPPGERLG